MKKMNVLIVIIMCMYILPHQLLVYANAPEGTPVSDAEEFNNIRLDLNGQYYLVNDIDLSGYENWEPIGSMDEFFTGTLDGNGHKITGLNVDITNSEDSWIEMYTGLFGYISDAIIKNLGVCGEININTASDEALVVAGGLAGMCESGTIESCYSNIDITVNAASYQNAVAYAGGLVGQNAGGIISNCYTISNISVTTEADGDAQSYAGGLAGINNSTIETCYAAGMTIAAATGGSTTEKANGIAENEPGVTDCFYNSDAGTEDIYATGLSTAEMKEADNFSYFDFDEVWAIDTKINNGYPYLRSVVPEKSVAIKDITFERNDNGYSYSFTVKTNENMTGTFFVVCYDGNALVGCDFVTVTTPMKSYTHTDTIITDTSAETYKIMFCDGVNSMMPHCSATGGNIVTE